MNTPAGVTEEPLGDVEVTTSDVERIERALIDASTRLPVLVFYASAIGWLLLATLLGVIASIQMHAPDFLSGASLADGAALPDHPAASAPSYQRHGLLESRGPDGNHRGPDRR